MEEYKLFNQKTIESTKKFEKRLNEICQQERKSISISGPQSNVILPQKIEKNIY